MDQPEVAMMIKDNMEISIYVHNGRVEVELYWDGEMIAKDSMSIKEHICQ